MEVNKESRKRKNGTECILCYAVSYTHLAVHIQDTGLIENALDIRKYHSFLQTAAARLFVEDVRVIIAVENIACLLYTSRCV